MNTAVIVALITGAFSVLVVLIQQSRKENKTDHGVVAESLRQVHLEVHRVGTKVDTHIASHIEGNQYGGAIRPDQG